MVCQLTDDQVFEQVLSKYSYLLLRLKDLLLIILTSSTI